MTLITGDGTDDTDSSADFTDFFRSHNQCNPFQISVISDKGITLVEVLLAVVVLSVGLAGVLRAYAASIGALEVSRETVITIELLKEKMADVEQKMIEQGGISAGSASGRFDGKFADYNWAWGTTPTAQEGLYELTMSVVRADGARQVSLVTYAQDKDYEQ